MARLGLGQIKCMTAILFVGIRYKNPFSITMKKCDGYLRKTFHISANEQILLYLNSEISSGNMIVEILDSNKKLVFILDNENKEKTIKCDTKSKFYIDFKFSNTSGKFTFGWK